MKISRELVDASVRKNLFGKLLYATAFAYDRDGVFVSNFKKIISLTTNLIDVMFSHIG
jgi:hypothetical protein